MQANKLVTDESKESRFTTTAIWVSGGICGTMWMPAAKAGKPFRQNARSVWGFWNKGDSFRDALNGILTRDGGDFQDARFPIARTWWMQTLLFLTSCKRRLPSNAREILRNAGATN